MKVPFVMLSKYYQTYKEEIDRAFQNVMEEGNYILGKEVARFEIDNHSLPISFMNSVLSPM